MSRIEAYLAKASLAALCIWLSACSKDSLATDSKRGGPPPAAPVVAQKIEKTELTIEQTFLGETRSTADASLTVAESGRVRRVLVVEGDKVKKGQLLLDLDDRLAKAQLGEALAVREQVSVQKEQASREAQRYEQLHDEAVVSTLEAERETSEAERLKAQSQGAQAQVQVQSERVQRHRLVAPFDGIIARRHVDEGDWLNAGQAALQLVTPDRLEVLVRVPEEVLERLNALEGVELVSSGRRIKATLVGRVDALERSTRTALLRLNPEANPEWLRPGSSLRAAFKMKRTGGLVVPRDALVYGVAGVRVIKVSDDKAEPVDVEVVDTAGDQVLVMGEGLSVGDQVVTRGNERLRPGQAITLKGAIAAPTASQTKQ